MQKFRFRKFLKTISHGASPNTLGIGMGALWYAIGIHFEILKSHAKFFGPAKFWKLFSAAPTKHLRDRDSDPLVCDRNLLRNSKFACKIFRTRKFLKTIFHGASPNTLGIGMGALWHAIGIHFEILKSHARFFGPARFWKRFSTAPTKHQGIGIGTLWYAIGIYFGF